MVGPPSNFGWTYVTMLVARSESVCLQFFCARTDSHRKFQRNFHLSKLFAEVEKFVLAIRQFTSIRKPSGDPCDRAPSVQTTEARKIITSESSQRLVVLQPIFIHCVLMRASYLRSRFHALSGHRHNSSLRKHLDKYSDDVSLSNS